MKQSFKYEVIIYWSKEDGSFIAEVQELPGCMTDGETYIDAINNVETMMAEWHETAMSLGRNIPKLMGCISNSSCCKRTATELKYSIFK